jgi:hypothetical protein
MHDVVCFARRVHRGARRRDEVMSSYSRSHESRTLNKKAQTDKTIVFPSNNSHTFYFEYYASIHFSDMVANLLNNSAQA